MQRKPDVHFVCTSVVPGEIGNCAQVAGLCFPGVGRVEAVRCGAACARACQENLASEDAVPRDRLIERIPTIAQPRQASAVIPALQAVDQRASCQCHTAVHIPYVRISLDVLCRHVHAQPSRDHPTSIPL